MCVYTTYNNLFCMVGVFSQGKIFTKPQSIESQKCSQVKFLWKQFLKFIYWHSPSIMVTNTFISTYGLISLAEQGLTHARLGMDSSRLSHEQLLEFGNCLQRIGVAMMCSIDRTVCRTTHTCIWVTNFHGFYLTAKNTYIIWVLHTCRHKKGTPVKEHPG